MHDSHVHSNFSGDSQMDPKQACEFAINIGLGGLTFTDHLDIDYPEYDNIFLIDFEKYCIYMNKLKSCYDRRLKILKGIEVGLQPHVYDKSLEIINKYDFDFVIASVHIVDRLDLHKGEYTTAKSQQEAYSGYLNEVARVVKDFDHFHVLGHLDLIRRYGDYPIKNLKYSDFSDIIDDILTTLIKKGKGIELNTSGFRYGLSSPMPNFDVVGRFRELGGEILTLGSDAHSTAHLGFKFGEMLEMIKQTGFHYVTHFEGGKPVFLKI